MYGEFMAPFLARAIQVSMFILGMLVAGYLGGVFVASVAWFILTSGFPGRSTWKERATMVGTIVGWPVVLTVAIGKALLRG